LFALRARLLSAQSDLGSGEAPFWWPEKFLNPLKSGDSEYVRLWVVAAGRRSSRSLVWWRVQMGGDQDSHPSILPASQRHGRARVASTPDQLVDLAFDLSIWLSIAPNVTDAGSKLLGLKAIHAAFHSAALFLVV
jgi:hypothetical protein